MGFALENFDLVGQWREFDGESRVNPNGVLLDGTEMNSPADLRRALMTYSDLFVETMMEKLMMYALGRELEYFDMPTVRSIMANAESSNFSFSALVRGIVTSEQFTKRVKSDTNSLAERESTAESEPPEA